MWFQLYDIYILIYIGQTGAQQQQQQQSRPRNAKGKQYQYQYLYDDNKI
jgi:hypothetical protein